MKHWLEKRNLFFSNGDINGSLGDMGTFIPLAVGLVSRCGFNLGHILLFAGGANIAGGLLFGLPMPVQPMKAIASIAIAEGMKADTIMAAGITSGLVLLFLSLTGLFGYFYRIVPKTLIRGLQLAIGLKLMLGGLDMIKTSGLNLELNSIYISLACFIVITVSLSNKNIPGVMILFLAGVLIALYSIPESEAALSFGSSLPTLRIPELRELTDGFIRAAMPQIPLTVLNSVAVSALSVDLFPNRPLAPRAVALNVSVMNLIGCLFGGMPMCNGAGGLASQYKFGARSGGSVVFLGLIMILAALALGNSLLALFAAFPTSVLGVLLVFSGLELAIVCRDQSSAKARTTVILTAAICVTINTAIGFAAGWIIAAMMMERARKPAESPQPAISVEGGI